MRRFRGVVWTAALTALITGLWIAIDYPVVNVWLLALTLASIAMLGTASLWLTYQDGSDRKA
jgi:hypothetical protein